MPPPTSRLCRESKVMLAASLADRDPYKGLSMKLVWVGQWRPTQGRLLPYLLPYAFFALLPPSSPSWQRTLLHPKPRFFESNLPPTRQHTRMKAGQKAQCYMTHMRRIFSLCSILSCTVLGASRSSSAAGRGVGLHCLLITG